MPFQVELESLGPELVTKSQDVEQLMVRIAQDQERADAVKKVVGDEELAVKEVAMQTELIAAEAQRDLDEALPALNAAYKALDSLEKKDIAEMKAFSKPPELVMTVMEAICILFKVKPDWDNSKKLLSDPQFLKKLADYDKDNIPEAMSKKLRKYTELPTFKPDIVEKVSKASRSLCMWAKAVDLYSHVFKEVQPKRQKLQEAQESLESTRLKLKEKSDALVLIESELGVLKQEYDSSIASKKLLADKTDETRRRLQRAAQLTVALADEEIRWKSTVEKLDVSILDLVGNIFLSAACVAYFGAFTSNYRAELIKGWIQKCAANGIPVSSSFNLLDHLVDPVQVRDWTIQGLPTDSLSIENGILVTRGRRWPLMIDPQGQANRWIRRMEGARLQIIKLSDPKYLRSLEQAIRTGMPVLLEDIGEHLDPALEPLLLKQLIRQGGRNLLKLGDTMVEYDKSFKLYLTTNLPNPHYLPEVCIKVTIINFTVTQVGLQNQLLGDVVKLERAELELQRDNLVINLSRDKSLLKELEEKILKMLFNSQGNILDDEELIAALNQSKLTSNDIVERVRRAEETERQIEVTRQQYLPVAIRGAVLYFVLARLAEIDPMYQFSLRYFKQLFSQSIQSAPPQTQLSLHVSEICHLITRSTFVNVSRALFECHKLTFIFMVCTGIMRESGAIKPQEWSFFLSGEKMTRKEGAKSGGSAVNSSEIYPPCPKISWMNESLWHDLCDLSHSCSIFKKIPGSLLDSLPQWEQYMNAEFPFTETIPAEFGMETKPTVFHRLMLVKSLREERLIVSIPAMIGEVLGPDFTHHPALSFSDTFKELNNATPLIFILSSGSDPLGPLMKFANDLKKSDRLSIISLGQGQGPIAEDLIRRSFLSGTHMHAHFF